MSRLSTYNHVILDCDGVVFDSNTLKVEAFERTLSDEHIPENIINAFIENHKQTGGISRYVKFKNLFTDFLLTPFDESMYQRLLTSYGDHCKSLYQQVAFTTGFTSFLERIVDLNIKLHIASGSDGEELKEVFAAREIDKFFTSIFGSPTPKNDCVAAIISADPNKKYVMIGDALSDYKAASSNNIDFIAMTGYSEVAETLADIANKNSLLVINDLSSLF